MQFKDTKIDFDIDIEKWEVEAYASTFGNVDSMHEIVDRGAFTKTIKERFPKNLIKGFWRHRDPFGVCKHIEEDSTGLLTVTKVSKTTVNKDNMILIKDKAVDRMSIGYDVIKREPDEENENDIHLKELRLYEYSPVPIAANEEASILDVKSMSAIDFFDLLSRANMKFDIDTKKATSYSNLPLAERMHKWDANAAKKRIANWAGGPDKEDVNWSKYRKAFFWYDPEEADNFGGYKLPFTDIIGGNLTAIPKGIFAAVAVIQGARGGVRLPSSDVNGVKSHIEKYYAKMRGKFDDDTIIAPWKKESLNLISTSGRQKLTEAMEVLNQILTLTDTDAKKDEDTIRDMLNEMQSYRKIIGG